VARRSGVVVATTFGGGRWPAVSIMWPVHLYVNVNVSVHPSEG
jgi:hypothetical protein